MQGKTAGKDGKKMGCKGGKGNKKKLSDNEKKEKKCTRQTWGITIYGSIFPASCG